MKTISPDLQTAIENGKIAYIISITTKGGDNIRYTNHDRPLTVNGNLYKPGAGLTRVKLTAKGNQEVSSQEFESAWTVDIDEVSALNGLYDDAQVTFSWVSWDHPEHGALEIFKGNLGLLSWTSDGFQAEIHNAIRKLQNPVATYYTPFCRHNFGDTTDTNKAIPGGCNVNLVSYTFNGTVSGLLTSRRKFIFTGTAAAKANAYFSFGVVTWLTGANTGRKSDVKIHTVDTYGSQVEFYIPTIFEIAPTDTFTIVAGCDKSRATCKTNFNNVVNFGAFPDLTLEVNFR